MIYRLRLLKRIKIDGKPRTLTAVIEADKGELRVVTFISSRSNNSQTSRIGVRLD